MNTWNQSKELVDFVVSRGGAALPAPRLQLTWQAIEPDAEGYNSICHYHLVLPVGKYDIRNPHEYKRDSFLLLDLGGTRSTGGIANRVYESGKIDTPFRDGSHAAWDSHRLNLPAFVVCGDSRMAIAPRAQEPDSQEQSQ